MPRLHLEKSGIRCLAVAESYAHGDAESVLAGVVMSSAMTVDGFALGRATVSGSDATDSILAMYNSLIRSDISYMLIRGTILSHYNMVDVRRLSTCLSMPVLGVSGRVRHKIRPRGTVAYTLPCPMHPIRLLTGHTIYAKVAGCTLQESSILLNRITLQGGMPEPLRLAGLLASAIRRG